MKLLLLLIVSVNLVVGSNENLVVNYGLPQLALPCHDFCYAKEWPCLDCYNACMQECKDGRPSKPVTKRNTPQLPTTTPVTTTTLKELKQLPCHDFCYSRDWPCVECYKKCMQQCGRPEEIVLKKKPCHDFCYDKEWPCRDCYNKCMQQCPVRLGLRLG